MLTIIPAAPSTYVTAVYYDKDHLETSADLWVERLLVIAWAIDSEQTHDSSEWTHLLEPILLESKLDNAAYLLEGEDGTFINQEVATYKDLYTAKEELLKHFTAMEFINNPNRKKGPLS